MNPWDGGQRGSVMVEFILIIPLLLLLAMGVWEFGRVVNAQLVATNAAREGARHPATKSDFSTTGVRLKVMNHLANGYGSRLNQTVACDSGDVCLTTADISVVYCNNGGTCGGTILPGGEIRVTVPVKVRIFTNFVPGLDDPFTVTGYASMQIP